MARLRRCVVLLGFACACTTGVSAPEVSATFSFEQGMDGWAAVAADTGAPPGAYAPWSIVPATDFAYDGEQALRLFMANHTDAAKIWIVRSFAVAPGRMYDVDVSYAFGSSDFGTLNLFDLRTGSFLSPPADGPALLAGTLHDYTGNGSDSDIGYRWLRKHVRTALRADASGLIYVVVGIWGTTEFSRTYYLDDLTVQVTRD